MLCVNWINVLKIKGFEFSVYWNKNVYKKNGKKSETSESKRINLLVDNTFIVSNGFFEVRQDLRQTAESVGGQRICCLTKNETKSGFYNIRAVRRGKIINHIGSPHCMNVKSLYDLQILCIENKHIICIIFDFVPCGPFSRMTAVIVRNVCHVFSRNV